jgi:urate oxidase
MLVATASEEVTLYMSLTTGTDSTVEEYLEKQMKHIVVLLK